MHVLDDPFLPARVCGFLAAHGEHYDSMPAEQMEIAGNPGCR